MSRLDQYAQMKALLLDMENDLGLQALTAPEKVIIAAISQIRSTQPADGYVESSTIQAHRLCQTLTAPTFFRALAALRKKGILELPAERAKNLYRLNAEKI